MWAGKQVRLLTEGDVIQVACSFMEQLAALLAHIVCSTIDHELECPDLRLAAGKPSVDTVRITARQRSGRMVIEVADDGAGIDCSQPDVVRRSIETMGGCISMESQAGLGSMITINVPVSRHP